jgi:hypothetical protein
MKPCTRCSCSGHYVDYGGFDCGGVLVPCEACNGAGWVSEDACPCCGQLAPPRACVHVYIQDYRSTLVTWRCWKCGDVKHGFCTNQTIRTYGTVQIAGTAWPAGVTVPAGVTWRPDSI